ncbi:hypothetical protein [Streptomyces sp. NPDC096152]|uniref:hypothetical protein n=1 Tax=Streptomyces sp. NPDC096152 TaxID=3366078 RepID=UPI0038239056
MADRDQFYVAALAVHALGDAMKIVWSLFALLLGCLSLGGLMSAARHRDPLDLLLAIGLGWAAVGVWRSARR